MKKQMLLAMILVACGAAHAQEFPETIVDCRVGKRLLNVELGSMLFDGKGGSVVKPGMVGMRWGGGGAKVEWGKAVKQSDGSFKIAFPGRKPMTIKVLREPVDDMDLEPILTIQEEGGKVIQCVQALA